MHTNRISTGYATEFGHDIIRIDSTHSTNTYDFNLSIIVIDKYGEGISVAWMSSNREDAMAMNPFYCT